METLLRAGLSNAVAATLMATLVTAVSRPLARRPAILHGLWLLVLIKLVTPPFYEIPIPWPIASTAPSQAPLEVAIVEMDAAAEVVRGDHPDSDGACPGIVAGCAECPARSCPGPVEADTGTAMFGVTRDEACRWIGLTWLAGSSAVLLLSLRRIRRFQRLLKEVQPGTWLEQDWVDDWARRLGLRRSPDLWWVPGRISPMIWFVGSRPRLIIPRELWKRLDGRQRSTLIAHELAHLRRGDHVVRLLEMLVTALFWWHPLVWWMRGPLREVEEQCCDAWVVWAVPDAVRAYAETLLDTLEFLQQSGRPDPLLASGLGQVPHLKRRLTMIMSGTSRRLPGLPGWLGLLSIAAVLLPIGASWAQKPDEHQEKKVVIRSDGTLDVFGTAVVQEASDSPAEKDEPTEAVVVVRGDREAPLAHRVELSGSLEDVIKELEAMIVDLKKEGETKPASKERIDSLVKALDALKKSGAPARAVTIRSETRRVEGRPEHSLYLEKLALAQSAGEKAKEVAKTREEISRLKKNLKATVHELTKAQAKLRELGEDPGDTAVVRWDRSAPGVALEKRYTVVRAPIHATTTLRPVKPAPPASDQQRLEQIEKSLKDLQQEFDRLKKGSADRLEKK